jgi:proteasome component ECM29
VSDIVDHFNSFRASMTCLTASLFVSVLSLLGESLGGKSAVEFRQALRPYLGRLLPRILRACHDPNKQTRDQMSALWIGITGGGAEGRQAISTHLMSTIDILLEDTSSKIWRARVGACGALSEILVGCSWSALGGGGPVLNDDELIGKVASSAGIRILRIWNAVVRALDDVQGAVRDCGERLGRATRALSVRLCDPSRDSKLHASVRDSTVENENHEREATAAAATILRWLIRHGLDQTCAEATELCLSTLVDVVGVVRPTILEPSLPALLKSLLLAISALEPALFNNLQLRMDDKEQLERARLQIAQEGQLSVALTKCIELVPFVKLQTQKSIATELDAALRQSVGFATRAAIADAVSTLCRTCPAVFLFPGPNSTNPSVHLLRALYSASEQERGEAAKDKMVHALGNLASHCPPSSVRSLCVRACKKYVSSSGNNFDSASRRTASASLRAIALRASSHFGDGGPGDVWATRILPIAYIGRKDIDSKVSSMWQVVWDEGGSAAGLSGSSSNINSFGTTMEEKLLPSLVQECVLALHDVSWARRAAGSQALIDLVEMGILAPPPRSTQAPTSQGKSDVSRARVRAEASALALRECIYLLVKPRLWSGKVEVMKAAALIVSKWTAAIASNDSLFGWNDNEHSCPYYPFVIVRDVSDINDLFAGDGWFTRSSAESDFLLEGVSRSPLREDSIETDQCEDLIEADQLVFRSNLSFENDYGDEVETTVETKTDESGQSRTADLSFAGLCRFLIDQAIPQQKDVSAASSTDLLLPYRNSAFRCFRDVISSLPPECLDQRIVIFKCLSPALVATFGRSNQDAALSARESPVLVAAAINCFESCLWAGIGSPQDHVVHTDVHELTKLLQEVGGTLQPAWTVREAAVKYVAQLALKCCDDSIRRPVVVSEMIAVARTALADRKFWRVRFVWFPWRHPCMSVPRKTYQFYLCCLY